MKRFVRDLLRSQLVQRVLSVLAAEYLHFVWLTTKFTFDPPDVYERAEPHQPGPRPAARSRDPAHARRVRGATGGRRRGRRKEIGQGAVNALADATDTNGRVAAYMYGLIMS